MWRWALPAVDLDDQHAGTRPYIGSITYPTGFSGEWSGAIQPTVRRTSVLFFQGGQLLRSLTQTRMPSAEIIPQRFGCWRVQTRTAASILGLFVIAMSP